MYLQLVTSFPNITKNALNYDKRMCHDSRDLFLVLYYNSHEAMKSNQSFFGSNKEEGSKKSMIELLVFCMRELRNIFTMQHKWNSPKKNN